MLLIRSIVEVARGLDNKCFWNF